MYTFALLLDRPRLDSIGRLIDGQTHRASSILHIDGIFLSLSKLEIFLNGKRNPRL